MLANRDAGLSHYCLAAGKESNQPCSPCPQVSATLSVRHPVYNAVRDRAARPAMLFTSREGSFLMRHLMISLLPFTRAVWSRSLIAMGLGLVMVSGLYAADLTVSEHSFGCIKEWTKVRNTYITHADPQKLKDAVRIFKDSVPNKEYPVGTFLQLLPDEAMVKHPKQKFPETNGWEFFHLDLTGQGTKIASRGDQTVNFQGVKCMSCHQPAVQFDFVCEKGHGCAPVPIDDQQIAALQNKDPRCKS
ncbi:hypothetical protein NITLEN_30269 [Nitrospira lenta]|uniref:Cytochrome P460 domain-containing protein n=2 Tax=Nitrospira lenta TaxID=1436998 RepID=A0A330L6A1_9BACT|nr:hypothetical protein NITLEN_30269 [Nitrospira lenta]